MLQLMFGVLWGPHIFLQDIIWMGNFKKRSHISSQTKNLLIREHSSNELVDAVWRELLVLESVSFLAL